MCERICKTCGGDDELAKIAERMGFRPDIAFVTVRKYENLLFKLGAMNAPPCFKCGYNGPGYFQPDQHECAKKHHELFQGDSEI